MTTTFPEMKRPGAALPPTMRAWAATAYGGPEVLALHDVPLPRLGAHDVLVRVEATTVSSADRRIRAFDMPRGMALPARAALGFQRPRQPVLGTELTGIVAAVGARATGFAPGDAVIAFMGASMGAHAPYCLVRADRMIVPRPAGMTLECAAALGFGGTAALDFLRRARVAPGERVLVIGASGTVGSALVQLALLAGAEVGAVTSRANLELARGLGAHEAIAYDGDGIASLPARLETATRGARWDIVADAAGALDFRRARPLLAQGQGRGGRYLSIAGDMRDLMSSLWPRAKGAPRVIAGPAGERRADLAELADLAARGLFRPLIDAALPYSRLPEAHARADTGRKRGSLVVTLTEDDAR